MARPRVHSQGKKEIIATEGNETSAALLHPDTGTIFQTEAQVTAPLSKIKSIQLRADHPVRKSEYVRIGIPRLKNGSLTLRHRAERIPAGKQKDVPMRGAGSCGRP